jgi:hypothetical protein
MRSRSPRRIHDDTCHGDAFLLHEQPLWVVHMLPQAIAAPVTLADPGTPGPGEGVADGDGVGVGAAALTDTFRAQTHPSSLFAVRTWRYPALGVGSRTVTGGSEGVSNRIGG